MKSLFILFSFAVAQAPIPNRPAGWVYDPNEKGFTDNPIEIQGNATRFP